MAYLHTCIPGVRSVAHLLTVSHLRQHQPITLAAFRAIKMAVTIDFNTQKGYYYGRPPALDL